MGRRPFLFGRKDIFRDGEEDAGVLPEHLDIEHLLGIAEAQVFEL